MTLPRIPAALILALCALAAPRSHAQSGVRTGDWPSYGGDSGSTKYSALSQIDRSNFEKLKLVWRWKSIDAPFQDEIKKKFPRSHISNLKATPLMVKGVLYLCTPLYQAAAINAATGEQLWEFNSHGYEKAMPAMSMGFNQRGVAYWTDGKDERIYWGTGDGYLIAVDAKTGKLCPDFGEAGRVDLTQGIAYADRARRDIKDRFYYSVASPPIVCRDVVVTPCSISDDPMDKEMPAGHIRGFDARTGKMKWIFHTVPQPGEPGYETWENDSAKYSGNTNVWTMISADEELGYLYLPIGTPTNDFYGGHRPGANLYGEAILCLDAATGKKIWHYQTVHHGLWDYDPPCAPNLVDLTVSGKKIKAVAQVTKQGFTFIFDRKTGDPVWPIEEKPVPTSDIPGEKTYPTQPFPTKPPSFESQGIAIDNLIDFTPALRAEAEEIVSHYRIGPLFTPPSLPGDGPNDKKGSIQNPGWGGGANWTGAGLDPETGIIYIPSSTGPIVPIVSKPDPRQGNLNYVRNSIAGVRGPQGLPLLKPPYSRITAIDLNKGEILWQVPNGIGSSKYRNHPALKDVKLPPLGGGRGAPLVTKTLLLVTKSGEAGSQDPSDQAMLIAYDKATGEAVGKLPLPASALGAPMTYELSGKQYVAVTVLSSPPELIAFALP